MVDDISHLVGKYTLRDPAQLMEFSKVFGGAAVDKSASEKMKPEDFILSTEISQDPVTRAVTISRNFGGFSNSNTFKLGEKYDQDNMFGETVESVTELIDGVIIDRPKSGIFKGRAASMGSGPNGSLKFGILDDAGKEIAVYLPRDK